MEKQSIHAGHRERMRKRLAEGGLNNFRDHEVLEWLLYYTIPRGDVNPLAHHLISTFGSLAGVLKAEYNQLLEVKGIGENTALFLSNYLSVFGRFKESQRLADNRSNRFSKKEQIVEFFIARFVDERSETLRALVLDHNCDMIGDVVVSRGSLESVKLDMRKLATECLAVKATKVVLAHNHPSGILLPSSADISATTHACATLRAVGVELVDHLIIGTEEAYSMANDPSCDYLFGK